MLTSNDLAIPKKKVHKTLSEDERLRRITYMAKWRRENKDTIARKAKERQLADPAKYKAKLRREYLKNRTSILKKKAAYWQENKAKISKKRTEKRLSLLAERRGRDREFYARNKEKLKAKKVAYRKEFPHREAATQRKYYSLNKEKAAASYRKWCAENQEKIAAIHRRRRARKKNAPGFHTPEDILRIAKDQKYKCAYCRVSIKKQRHVDHIVPLASGGSDWAANLQILCPACNCQKRSKDPVAFAQQLGKLI